MNNLLHHILRAIPTFAVTNIDDILLLSFYFAHPNYKHKEIVIGQYMGVIALIIISLSGLILGQIIDPHWINWLGLFPIFLGFKSLYFLLKNMKSNLKVEESPMSTKPGNQLLNIALITFANGGDNIGVYTPLFANLNHQFIPIYLVTFLIMIGAWCFMGYKVGKHPTIKKYISKFGHIFLPIFLIFLGLSMILSI